MDDPVAAGDQRLDRSHIGDVEPIDHLLAVPRRRQRRPVRQPQHWIDAAQGLAQRAADAAAGAGDQDPVHHRWPPMPKFPALTVYQGVPSNDPSRTEARMVTIVDIKGTVGKMPMLRGRRPETT